MKLPILRFLILVSMGLPMSADPFPLIDPATGSTRWIPEDMEIGANADGYLMAGLAAHHPVSIPLRANGEAATGGLQPLGVAAANAVDEPLWVGDRWLVLVSPGSFLPDRLAIAQLDGEGFHLSEPLLFDWEDLSRARLASNGRTVLAAGLVEEASTTSGQTLSVRVVDRAGVTVGPERFVAADVDHFEIVATDQGYLIVWSGPEGLWFRRLDDEGFPRATATRILGTARIVELSMAATSDSAMVVWMTGDLPNWTIEGARLDDVNGSVQSIGFIDAFSSTSQPEMFVETLDGGYIIGWQRVNLIDDDRKGGEIFLRRFLESGMPAQPAWSMPRLTGGEVLMGAASRLDSELLVSFTRSAPETGRSLWSSVISGQSATSPRLISVSEGSPQALQLDSAGDGSTWGVWVETTGTGYRLNTARWNAQGKAEALATIVHVNAILGRFDIATNGAETMVVWHQGNIVYVAPLDAEGKLAREPFRIAFVAGVEQGLAGADPVITWSGASFVVAWKQSNDVRMAKVVPSGIQRPLGVVGTPPITPGVSYSFEGLDVAAIGDAIFVTAQFTETFSCSQAPCPSRGRVGLLLTDGSQPRPFSLGPVGIRPRVEAGNELFMIGWSSTDGVRLLPIDLDGTWHGGVLAFRWPTPGAPAIAKRGGGFTVAARYGMDDWARVVVLDVDQLGRRTSPEEGFEVSVGLTQTGLQAAGIGGDALLGWVSRGTSAGSPFTLMGEFVSDSRPNPQPPTEPTGVEVTPLGDGTVRVSWQPVPNALGYQVDRLVTWPDGTQSWVHVTRTSSTMATSLPGEIRVVALNRGGASGPPPPEEPEESSSRRRSVRRP